MSELISNVAEIGFGVLFIIGAIFHSSYTLHHGREIYKRFANNAWFYHYRRLIKNVIIPHATYFTVILIFFQASIGLMLLTRGSLVVPALIAGALFSFFIIPASNVRGAMANLILTVVLILLILTN